LFSLGKRQRAKCGKKATVKKPRSGERGGRSGKREGRVVGGGGGGVWKRKRLKEKEAGEVLVGGAGNENRD